uniref:Uncharacterized protein n=1 Tax=Avena sativa TaxID=4498 RepID=A0ACD5TT83_AVESA
MKATARRGGCAGAGAVGDLPAVKTRKKRKDGGGGFAWGCGGSRSVSVVVGKLSTATAPQAKPPSSATASAKQPPATTVVAPVVSREPESAPSVDALLRQLRELERGVRALGVRDQEGDCGDAREACRCSSSRRPPPRRHQHHRRGASEVFGGSAAGVAASAASASARRGRLEEESVAVVTETEDPLGEFRRSMAEMVVENGITGGAELRELLQRFLSLNSPRHHHLILIAFADVWEELFAAGRPVVPRHPPTTKPRLSPPPDVSTSS